MLPVLTERMDGKPVAHQPRRRRQKQCEPPCFPKQHDGDLLLLLLSVVTIIVVGRDVQVQGLTQIQALVKEMLQHFRLGHHGGFRQSSGLTRCIGNVPVRKVEGGGDGSGDPQPTQYDIVDQKDEGDRVVSFRSSSFFQQIGCSS